MPSTCSGLGLPEPQQGRADVGHTSREECEAVTPTDLMLLGLDTGGVRDSGQF